MPELPDITAYITALESRILGQRLEHVRIASAFLLRTAQPPVAAAEGKTIRELRRIGKRIAIGLEDDLWLVLHLMIAGRLHWRPPSAKLAGRNALAAFDFSDGSLVLTEAGSKPRIVSGIGNAYSDEILHAAKLSPITLTQKLTPAQWDQLYTAMQQSLQLWMDRLGAEAQKAFPEKVTAFRPEMSVHGRFDQPCPICGEKIQRIRYADNETDYCARCQTGGKVLADRSLSRLLKSDWPRTLDELEALKRK